MDDYFWFQKLLNYTVPPELLNYEEQPGIINKTMNLTKLLAMNFADSLPNCYLFSESVYTFENLRWDSFDGSLGLFIEAFLFNIMASADEFLKYFDKQEVYMSAVNEFGEPAPKYELIWQ